MINIEVLGFAKMDCIEKYCFNMTKIDSGLKSKLRVLDLRFNKGIQERDYEKAKFLNRVLVFLWKDRKKTLKQIE